MTDGGLRQAQDAGGQDMLVLIGQLEALLERGRRLPGGRLVIEEEAARELLDRLRDTAPDAIRHGQRFASERERVLAEARAQARRLVDEAEAQARRKADDSAVMLDARARARELVTAAESQAEKVRADADRYVLSQLNNLESRIQRLLREIHAGAEFLGKKTDSGDG